MHRTNYFAAELNLCAGLPDERLALVQIYTGMRERSYRIKTSHNHTTVLST
jgi:hypothetical protein